MMPGQPSPAEQVRSPATAETGRRWRQAGRALLVKLIAELAYEELLHPEADDASTQTMPRDAPCPPIGRGPAAPFHLRTPRAGYRFLARRGTFGSWWIDAASLTRTEASPGSVPTPADDPVRFIQDAQPVLEWSDAVLADVARDLRATQAADDRLLLSATETAAELAMLSFVELEGRLSGHPCLVANKGRLGFAASASTYTPEARTPFRLIWVAAHRTIGRFSVPPSRGTSYPTMADLLVEELDPSTRAHFAAVLADAAGPIDAADAIHPVDSVNSAAVARSGQAPAAGSGSGGREDSPDADRAAGYIWLPVHPWQWENVIAPLFAAEIATGRLVRLGEAPDRYLPLQAVRTLANVDRPDRRNVKLALMIRNTLVWRGMSPADAEAGPAVSRWLIGLRDADPFLRDVTRVLPLPEVAGASVAHPVYDALPQAPYRLHELLGVLWRDPVERFLDGGERARSLAALLAVGADGRPLAAELVARSGRTAHAWCSALLDALLPPLLHYLYRYGVAFTPHGENVICVFDADDLPRRIAVKDFGADIELVEGDFPERRGLPPEAAPHCRPWPGPVLAHSLLSAVFAGHFRYFAVLIADHLGLGEEEFWRLVRATLDGYHGRFPELRRRFQDIDLLVPRFGRVCLNREQFAGAGFHDRADRDGGFDLISGDVANPLHSVSAVGGDTKAGAVNR